VSEGSAERRLASIVAGSINQATSPLVARLMELEKEQEMLKAQLDKVTNEVIRGVIESSLDIALKKTTLDLTSKIDTMTSSLTKIEANLEKLQVGANTEEIEALRSDIEDLKARVDEIKEQAPTINTEELKNAIAETISKKFEEEYGKIVNEIEGTNKKLDALSTRIADALNTLLQQIRSDIASVKDDDLKRKVTSVEYQLSTVIAKDLDEIKSTLSDLKSQGKTPSPPSKAGRPLGTNVEVEGGEATNQ